MKCILRLFSILFLLLGANTFLSAQGCPTSVTRNCSGGGPAIAMTLDIDDCSKVPDGNQVFYTESDGNPMNGTFGAPTCAPAGVETVATNYNQVGGGCDAGQDFSLRINYINNAGPEMTCQYSAAGALLPVELVYFRSEIKENTVQLFWQTASEINNEGFQVEYSKDGKTWEMLDFIDGKGTTTELVDYAYNHESPAAGITNYYRLRQIDFDGAQEFSRIASEFIAGAGDGQINVFPNPISGKELNVEFYFTSDKETLIQLTDALGRTVWANQIFVTEKGQRQVLDLPQVTTGNYYLIVQTEAQIFHKKIMVN